jgi:hypothetical protein
MDPILMYHDRDITDDAPDDLNDEERRSAPVPENATPVEIPQPDVNMPELRLPNASLESPSASPQVKIRGRTTLIVDIEDSYEHTDEVSELTELVEEPPVENRETALVNVRANTPPRPPEPREKSTRIRKPVDRLN